MAKLRARLAKITFGQAPAFLVGISVVRTEMESGEEDRRYFLAVAVILFGALLDLAPPRKKFLESRSYRKPAVAQALHAPQRVLVVPGGDPNGDRPLDRFGLDANLFEAIVFAFEGKRGFGP